MSEFLTEVPEGLKRLTRFIVRGFYSVEHSIIIDFLVRNPCMKEDDLLELLKFERKQLRANLETLKQDQFLKTRMRLETDREGKTTRHNYYFINYKVFVNVVKYKLDHMRRKIETEERDSTSRASFKCPQCEKQYTDLEADQLFDFMTQQFICMYCGAEVEEQMQATPKKDAITLVAKFNEQIEPLYVLLREVEDVKLAPEILEPEPTNVANILNKPKDRGSRDHTVWSGDLKRGIGFGDVESSVTVDIGDNLNKPKQIVQKERPIWMTESTVEGAQADSIFPDTRSMDSTESKSMSSGNKKNESNDIMKTLLVHENKSNNPLPNKPATTDSSDDDEPMSTSGVKDESIESDEDEEIAMVHVEGVQVPFNEVTEDMVARMTFQEKEYYIKLGQEIHSHLYD